MHKITWFCNNCHWEGDEPHIIMVDNLYNPNDHTLYEHEECPQCGSDDLSAESKEEEICGMI